MVMGGSVVDWDTDITLLASRDEIALNCSEFLVILFYLFTIFTYLVKQILQADSHQTSSAALICFINYVVFNKKNLSQ